LILPEVLDFCRLRKQKDYIVVKMGKHEMELAIADTQTIISMIESGMRCKDCLLSVFTILESFRAPRSVINFGLPDLCLFSMFSVS
jgi:hypothetical protein